MSDRLAEIKEQWASDMLDDESDIGWLIAEVERLKAEKDTAEWRAAAATDPSNFQLGIEAAAKVVEEMSDMRRWEHTIPHADAEVAAAAIRALVKEKSGE